AERRGWPGERRRWPAERRGWPAERRGWIYHRRVDVGHRRELALARHRGRGLARDRRGDRRRRALRADRRRVALAPALGHRGEPEPPRRRGVEAERVFVGPAHRHRVSARPE